jgi:alpha-ketoglutarate-dependent taurine dioxygenase
MFGPIKVPVGRTRDGGELHYDVEMQVIDAGFVLTEELRQQLGDITFGGDTQRPGLFETFHVDDTYTERPAAATILNAQALPPSGGGDTRFMDMRAAYASLDPELRRRLLGLRAVYAYNNRDAFPPRVSAAGPNDALVEVVHPIVRKHPVTGGGSTSTSTAPPTSTPCRSTRAARCSNACRITPRRTRRATPTAGAITTS